MISKYLSETWALVAPTVANHLWQSTLFAVAAGLLTLVLRENHARSRYWLWLAASVKFLIPFSLLVNLGSHLATPGNPAEIHAGLYFAMAEVSQPFKQPTAPVISSSTPSPTLPNLMHLLPALLVAVWLCGFAAVLCMWCVRWWRLSVVMRKAVPLQEGREVEALRRLEGLGGQQGRVELSLSSNSLEPGIFGVFRPVLVWPEGISEHLQDSHLEAILAHEVSHVRRRDNLTAAIHMVVEAIFWFHPLIWWLGAKLVEERERACDEEVLQLGSQPQVYAESILKACEFCVSSPLACISGVTGSDLKKRIVRIMTEPVAHRLDFRRKFLLGAAGILAIAVPLMFGLQDVPQGHADSQGTTDGASVPTLKFEVASIKQDKSGDGQHLMMRIMSSTHDGRFYATNVNLKMLLRMAYDVQDSQILGGPSWLNSERYDIEAKSDSFVNDQLRRLSPDQAKLAKQRMLQALLADRFQLTLRRETKELPVYALVVAKNGPKLQKTKDPDGIIGPDGRKGQGGMFRMTGRGEMNFQRASAPMIAQFLSQQLNRTVLDKTGLKGNYDFTLQWTPDPGQGLAGGAGAGANGQSAAGMQPASNASDSSGPSLFTALQEQLGLKLKSQKGPVEVLAIEHVEKPSEN